MADISIIVSCISLRISVTILLPVKEWLQQLALWLWPKSEEGVVSINPAAPPNSELSQLASTRDALVMLLREELNQLISALVADKLECQSRQMNTDLGRVGESKLLALLQLVAHCRLTDEKYPGRDDDCKGW